MLGVAWKFGASVMLLAAGAAVQAVAQSAAEPPAGTIAADMKERAGSSASYHGVIDVTAMNTTFVAIGDDGVAVLDIRPEEILVLEDGKPAKLLALVPGLGPEEHPPGKTEAGVTADGGVAGDVRTSDWQPWRVVIYVSTELAGRYVLRNLCQQTAEEAARLTDLGPVDVVLADPTPTLVAEANYQSEDLRQALEDLASKASGLTTVERIRTAFTNEFRPGFGFNAQYDIGQSTPSSMAARMRASVNRERTVVRRELDRMVGWMQSQPPAARGLLLWMTGGFDLNPADFYLPMMEQIDSTLAQNLRTDYTTLSLAEDVRAIIDVALTYGWTIIPLNSSRTTFLYGADIDGSGKVQQLTGVSANSIEAQSGSFRQVAPTHPLRIVAEGTGGELVTNQRQFETVLNHVKAAYLLSYQVDRPADGRLHRLEIRSSRPGIRLISRSFAASGSLRGVSETRARQLLGGEDIGGALVMSADIRNISKAGKGQKIGDLGVSADLRELRAVLSPLHLGKLRLTVMVEIENGAPFIHHQEIDLDWGKTADVWRFGAGIKWPKKAKRMVVVVEELVTSTWGATTVALK